MKTFGYTLRDKEGALKKGSLQAVDRIDALRQIKAMGCIPVAVTEGKGSVAGARAPWNPATWNRAVWVAVAGVVLIAALTVWLTADKKPVKRPAPATAAAGTPPRGVRSALPTSQTVKTVRPVTKPVPAPSAARTPTQGVPDETALPRPADASRNRPLPVPATEPEVAKELQPERPRPFKTSTEQLLAMAMSVPPGAAIPPLPIGPDLDEDFADSLTNVIVIYDDDDERTAAIKEDVAVTKNQLLELVKQGRSVSEVLKEYQETTNERAEVRNAAQRELADLLKNGTPAEAKAYLDKVNKAFTELGVEPIALPRQSAR